MRVGLPHPPGLTIKQIQGTGVVEIPVAQWTSAASMTAGVFGEDDTDYDGGGGGGVGRLRFNTISTPELLPSAQQPRSARSRSSDYFLPTVAGVEYGASMFVGVALFSAMENDSVAAGNAPLRTSAT